MMQKDEDLKSRGLEKNATVKYVLKQICTTSRMLFTKRQRISDFAVKVLAMNLGKEKNIVILFITSRPAEEIWW